MKNKILFIVLNIVASALSFIKSFIFLKYLPEKTLGIIVLFQAVIALFGLLQIGLINGGYRIFSISEYKDRYNTFNNLISTYIIVLVLILIAIGTLTSSILNVSVSIVIFGIIIGGFTLFQNWFTNMLIARNKLREVNLLNIYSNFISILFVVLIFKSEVIGAIISIASLNVVFVLLFLIRNKDLRPNSIFFRLSAFKELLIFGFIPYLSGIAYLINNQIDRFAIKFVLSTNALGQFYLAFTCILLYMLVPANINNLFFPKTMDLYSKGKIEEAYVQIKHYFIIMLLYAALFSFFTYMFGQNIVDFFFPEKSNQMRYVNLLIPGLIAISISQPIILLLNVAFNLKAILISEILSLFIYTSILLIFYVINQFTLQNVAIIKSIQGIFVLFYYLIIFLFCNKKIKEMEYIKTRKTNYI